MASALPAVAPPRSSVVEAARVRLRDDAIVEVTFVDGISVTLDHAQAITAAVRELAETARPVLADIRGVRGAGVAAMHHTAGPSAARLATRLAVLTGSPVSRMIGNVFLGLVTPYPTRLFTDRDEAAAWLLGERGDSG